METVRVMGKATSSRINYRSKGETNPENRETFRDERDLERASFVRRHGQICTNSSDKSLTSASVSSRFVGDDTRRIWEDARKTVDKGGGDDFTAFTGASGITHSTGFWSGASKETSNTLGLEHAELLSLYSKDLNRLLLPYMYKTTVGGGGDAVAAMSNWKEYGGAFLDFGTVSEYNCRYASAPRSSIASKRILPRPALTLRQVLQGGHTGHQHRNQPHPSHSLELPAGRRRADDGD